MNLIQFRGVLREIEHETFYPDSMQKTGKKIKTKIYVEQYQERENILEIGINPPIWSEWMDLKFIHEEENICTHTK